MTSEKDCVGEFGKVGGLWCIGPPTNSLFTQLIREKITTNECGLGLSTLFQVSKSVESRITNVNNSRPTKNYKNWVDMKL